MPLVRHCTTGTAAAALALSLVFLESTAAATKLLPAMPRSLEDTSISRLQISMRQATPGVSEILDEEYPTCAPDKAPKYLVDCISCVNEDTSLVDCPTSCCWGSLEDEKQALICLTNGCCMRAFFPDNEEGNTAYAYEHLSAGTRTGSRCDRVFRDVSCSRCAGAVTGSKTCNTYDVPAFDEKFVENKCFLQSEADNDGGGTNIVPIAVGGGVGALVLLIACVLLLSLLRRCRRRASHRKPNTAAPEPPPPYAPELLHAPAAAPADAGPEYVPAPPPAYVPVADPVPVP